MGAAAFSLFAFNPNALAFQEYSIGDEIEDTENHFKVALVYFRLVSMEPQGNECGVGEWIPYMRVHDGFQLHAAQVVKKESVRRRP